MKLPEGGNLAADQLRRIEYFAEKFCETHDGLYRYGWGHLLFACYAAFPAHLTADLLHKLRLNFRHYTAQKNQREIHPVAVNDLVLSNLVRETGMERYEMPEEIRHYLLWLLQHSKFFEDQQVLPVQLHELQPGQQPAVTRLNHLAAFLLRYSTDYYTAQDPVTRSLREAQEWTAQAWLDPKQAANRIREKLSNDAASPNERYHYGRLGNRLAAQYALHLNPTSSSAPASFKVIQDYTQGITSLYSGKSSQAQVHFKNLPYLKKTDGTGTASETGALRLPVPKEVVKQLLIDRPDLAGEATADTPAQAGTGKPLRWPDRETRLSAAVPKAILSIGDGDIQEILRALTRMETELREAIGAGSDFCLGDFYDIIIGAGKGAFMAAMLAARRQVADLASDIYYKEGAYKREGTEMMGDDGYKELAVDFFGERNINDPIFLSGLGIAQPNSDGLGFDFVINCDPPSPTQDQTFVSNYISIAAASPSGVFGNLALEVTPVLSKTRGARKWLFVPENLLWVTLDTEPPETTSPVAQQQTEPPSEAVKLENYIRSDMRWLEKHTLDLIGRNKFRLEQWDCDGERKVDWPRHWFESAESEEPSGAEMEDVSPAIYFVNTTSLNLRAGPDVDEVIIGKLKKDDTLQILNETPGWAQVRLLEDLPGSNIREGWVSRRYIALLSEKPEANKIQTAARKTSKTATSKRAPKMTTDGPVSNVAEPPDSAGKTTAYDKARVRDLLEKREIAAALELLPDDNHEILVQKSRFNRLQKEYIKGILSEKEHFEEQNRIAYGILSGLDIESTPVLKRSNETINQLRNILISGEIRKTLDMIYAMPEYSNNNDLILLMARFSNAERQNLNGLLTYGEWMLECNKITHALFTLMDEG